MNEKIHLLTKNDVGDIVYVCNQACGTTPFKSTKNQSEVTCRNCKYHFKAINLREELSDLEHQQWEQWSKTLARELTDIRTFLFLKKDIKSAISIIDSRLGKWKKNWKPYSKLDEPTKEFDREWADKVIKKLDGK